MPSRHPSEVFLKFLVTTSDPRMADNAMVNMTLTMMGFPPIADDSLNFIRAGVAEKIPPNFDPRNKYHRPSVRFMRQEGIYGLHNPDEASLEAARIVNHLRARPIIQDLLLGHHHPVMIAKKVNARLNEHFTSEGIEVYGHYYWNVNLLRIDEWDALLVNHQEERQRTLAILKNGGSMALHQAGFSQELESKAILQEMQEAIYFDFVEWQKQPLSLVKTKMMATAAKSITLIDERLQESNSLLKDSLKNFEKFRMQHARRAVVDVHELAPEGNFTNSGAKLLETQKKPSELEEEEE